MEITCVIYICTMFYTVEFSLLILFKWKSCSVVAGQKWWVVPAGCREVELRALFKLGLDSATRAISHLEIVFKDRIIP